MLTAREAIKLNAAFPYASGRRQLPLGDRFLVNDLYGTPPIRKVVGGPCCSCCHRGHGSGPQLRFQSGYHTPQTYEIEHRPRGNPGLV